MPSGFLNLLLHGRKVFAQLAPQDLAGRALGQLGQALDTIKYDDVARALEARDTREKKLADVRIVLSNHLPRRCLPQRAA